MFSTAPAMSAEFIAHTTAFHNKYPRQVLLCLLGDTPAVITETLSLLLKEGIRTEGKKHAFRPKELVIITTGDAANNLDVDGARFFEWLGKCLADWGYNANEKLVVHLHVMGPPATNEDPNNGTVRILEGDPAFTLKEYNRPNARAKQRAAAALNQATGGYAKTAEGEGDVRTDQQTQDAANYLLAQVAKLTLDHTSAVHASIAGGRKSMGALLTQVMSLVGRQQDTISHVLTHRELEKDHRTARGEPWIKQPWLTPADSNQLKGGAAIDKIFELSMLEFVRLFPADESPWLPSENYSELVQRINARLYGRIQYIETSKHFEVGRHDLKLTAGNSAILLWLLCQKGAYFDFSSVKNPTRLFETWRDALKLSGANTVAQKNAKPDVATDLYEYLKTKQHGFTRELKERFPNFIKLEKTHERLSDKSHAKYILLLEPALSRFDLDSIPQNIKDKLSVSAE